MLIQIHMLQNYAPVVLHKVVPPTGIAESHTPCSIAYLYT
jgi:hypothetical protein